MAIKFNQFTTGDTANTGSADYLVGYDSAQEGVPNGERKWALSTIANAVSGIMSTELSNKFANTATLSASPMVAKAWAIFDGRGTSTGSQTISASYNISSIARNGQGLFSVNFLKNMPTINYVVIGNASQSTGSTNCQVEIHSQNGNPANAVYNPTLSSFFLSVVDNSGANNQAHVVNFCVF